MRETSRASVGRRRWAARLAPGSLAALLALAGLTAAGRAEVTVGVRAGWSDVADEVFTGSGELGGTTLMGAHLGVGLLSLFELEVAGESITEEFDFSEGAIGPFEAVGEGTWEDLALYTTLRARLLRLVFLPVQFYAGGGLNLHWAELTLENVGLANRDAGPGDLEDEVKKVAGERTELGWHLVGGLRVVPGDFPVWLFAEGRYLKGFDTEKLPRSTSVYLGLSFRL